MEQKNYVLQELQDGKEHILLTGNAGTGKSTLIREFIAENEGEVIVLAPTGIAAINIGGETIHRFFHLPARTVSFQSVKYLDPKNPLDALKRAIIRRAKYIVIDEISMVRADLMDAIMWFFQKNYPGSPPFGGKKIIMIGDVNQLPPVIASEPEREMLAKRYDSEYFFHSKAWDTYASFKKIILTKIWRQTDPHFINFLGKMKDKEVTSFDLDQINAKCHKPDQELTADMGIVLCGTNKICSDLNQRMIDMEEGKIVVLNGTMEGNFDSKNCPVEQSIFLKIGCRIMIMRNGEGYYNGSIGELIDYNENTGSLVVKLNGAHVNIPRHEFKSIEYVYDSATDRITCKETGKFIQYPIRLAYAITIHKSQGATFDKVIIDLGERGAFAHGQTYVAFSRATSLEGITLRRPVQMKDLIYSKAVLEFNDREDGICVVHKPASFGPSFTMTAQEAAAHDFNVERSFPDDDDNFIDNLPF